MAGFAVTRARRVVAFTLAATALLAVPPAVAQSDGPAPAGWGFDLKGRDPAVSPGQDFYRSANGAYVSALQIPAERASYGSFDVVDERNEVRVRTLLDAAAADRAATGDRARVGALYRSFMDEARVNALGAEPLAADLADIRRERTRRDLARGMGRSARIFGGSVFDGGISEDARRPDRYAVYISQGGLGLPDRDYYLQPGFAAQKTAYQAYVARLLTLAGWPDPEVQAAAILRMESEIAAVSLSRAERRDSVRMYNALTVTELGRLAPGFDWKAYLSGARLGHVTRIVAREKAAFPKIAAVFARTPIETLKAWQAFTLADQAAPYLAQPFIDARFHFRSETLAGVKAMRPRWKRGVTVVDSHIGEALSQLYVDAYFPPQSKAQVLALVGDIRAAMKARIQKADWMSPATKARALDKLAHLNVKIGYPDCWRDYSQLTIRDGDLYGNVERSTAFEWDYQVKRLGGPVDRRQWDITPVTINAFYKPTANEIVFPAAILQPPFFDPAADPAVNYGAIGGVIGHELTHGFDDQGRRYDGSGRLTDWWTPRDAERFKAEAARLGRQYAAVEVLPGAKINPDLTMGENIADLGGMQLALDAYHLSLKGRPAPVLDGLTGDQRVLLGWAQVWRSRMREDAQRQLLVADTHSPDAARVNLPARNVDAFYDAFGVKPGDPMYLPPAERVRIW